MMKNIRILPTGRKQFFRRLIFIYLGIFSCGILSIGESYGQATQSYDVPRVISYQGVVHDNNGSLLSDGNYQIVASFYDDALGTSKIWQGKYTVTVSQGTFNVMLGSGDSPLPALKAMNKPIWVGIQVG